MNKSPQPISSSSDQDFYDQEPIASLDEHAEWMREIKFYFNSYSDRLNSALAGTNGHVAELGAGSCGLSVCLSQLETVRGIIALDISSLRMAKMLDFSDSLLKGDRSKITPLACDFNKPLPFSDGELDAIFFDAALHHTRSIWNTLAECNRVLKRNGLLIAQREAYLSPIRNKHQISKLLKSPEVAANVSENIYLFDQYRYYLSVAGFEVEFIRVNRSPVKNLLRFFNGGLLFTDGVLFCKKLDY